MTTTIEQIIRVTKYPALPELISLKIEKGDYKIIPIENTPEFQADIRSYLKNVFWPNVFVGASFQILEILKYSSGLKLISAALVPA